MKKILNFGLVLFLATLLFPYNAKAADKTGIQISPLTYNFEIKNDSSTTGKILVKNLNSTVLNYSIEVENFSSVSDEGAPTFAGTESEGAVTSLADWFTFDTPKEGTLEPKSEKEINFTISIPAGAEPGGHYSAVFVREIKKNSEGKTELGVASRVGTLILVSVPGETTKSAQISEFKFPKFVWRGPVNFSFKAENTGTVHYDSKGSVELKPILGSVRKVDMGTHTILPGNSRSFSGTWENKYPFGRYAVKATVTNGDGQTVTTGYLIWAIPVILIAEIILAIIVIILIVKYAKRHIKFVE